MSVFPTPIQTRHSRLFELLRQQDRAEPAAHPTPGPSRRQVSPDEAAQLRALAEQSFQRAR
ncbi:MAG: hypothetical protein AAF218_08055 [Pseudomonadota bacterium]